MTPIEHVGGDKLVVEALDFSYAERPIFEALPIDVSPGEFVAVLGPSGCGKTTLLNLLSGFSKPRRGRVLLRGRPIEPEDPHLGYVFQTPALFPWLTALNNVEFGLKMAGVKPNARRERAMAYLALVGLSGFEHFLPTRLSGGMQQRVSLARTLVTRPRLLLMDEPFAALDAITRESMNDELLRLWRELGQTVIFITHDIDESIYLSDRVLVLGKPPSGIHHEMKNALPRPRHGPTTRTCELFWQYKKELMSQVAQVAAKNVDTIAA